MRLGLALGMAFSLLYAQECAPTARLLPAGTVSASLDDSSCLLSDGTAYAAYRLDLGTRGQIQLDLNAGTADLILILRDATGAQIGSGTSIHQPIEAGSYSVLVDWRTLDSPDRLLRRGQNITNSVLVNGRVPDRVVPYTVTTAFTAEAGMLCSNFPSIGLNQAVAGALGVSGCTLPDGTPYEAYALTTAGSGVLTVSVSSSDFTTAVILRGDDGSALALGSSSIYVPVSGDSQYEVVVATADNTGAYQILTSFQPAGAETCVAKNTLSNSGSVSDSITANSCYGEQYYDYYNLTVPAAGVADLSASSGDFYPTLTLLDAAGDVLSTDSGGGGSPGQSELRLQLMPGSYTVQIASDVPSGGNYTLQYTFNAGPPQPCVLVSASPGATISGTLSASSCRTFLGLADLYSFTLPAAGTADIDVSSNSFATLVALRDTKDNLILESDNLEGLPVTGLTADLPAGTYTIVAAANSGAGSYQLVSTFTPNGVPPCTSAQQLSINGGYIQNLGASGCIGANGEPVDYYTFTLPSDSVVAAIMTSSDIDGYLTLTDSAGNYLRGDHDSYGANDPMIVEFLPAGTYNLAARAASSTVGGLYEVDLRTAAGPRPPFCASRATLALGGSITGKLSFASCQYTDGTFADIYQINLASGTKIALALDSNDFDAYLYLLDAQGNVVAQDDDSGGNLNSLIVDSLTAGTYYVVATAFGDYTAGGNYALSLAQSQ
jgi:hypothetical protein